MMAHVSQQTCIKVTSECTQTAATYFGRLYAIKPRTCHALPCPSTARVVWTSHIHKHTRTFMWECANVTVDVPPCGLAAPLARDPNYFDWHCTVQPCAYCTKPS